VRRPLKNRVVVTETPNHVIKILTHENAPAQMLVIRNALIIRQAPKACKTDRILHCDWLPVQDYRCRTQETSLLFPYNNSLIDQACSSLAGYCLVLFWCVYGPRLLRCLLNTQEKELVKYLANSRLVNKPYGQKRIKLIFLILIPVTP